MARYQAQPHAGRKPRNARTGSALPGMATGRGTMAARAIVAVLAMVGALAGASGAAAQASGCGPTHVVAVGDTLTNIAERCGVTPQALLEANPVIRDPNVVPLGAALTIPGGAAQAPSATPDPAAAPEGVASLPPLRVVPIGGPLDARVRLFATNLPPGAGVLIGGGPRPETALLFSRAQVDATGVLSVELALPDWMLGSGVAHLVVEAPIGGPWLRAAPYRIVSAQP